MHARFSTVAGHAAPPFDGCACLRVRVCVPAPHDLVHVLQAPYVPTTQSTGHACSLQARVSAECGHAAPPALGCVSLRLRDCEPAPQDFVQVDQAEKSPTSQLTGHCAVAHVRTCVRCGQALPPFVGATVVRSRAW